MVKIEKEWEWYLINGKFYLSDWFPIDWRINIYKEMWDEMIFWKRSYSIIDFPWEYEKDWYHIKVYSWKDGLLNYVIKINNKKVSIIQSIDILEKEEMEWIDIWLYDNEKVLEILEKYEYEWEKINIISWENLAEADTE